MAEPILHGLWIDILPTTMVQILASMTEVPPHLYNLADVAGRIFTPFNWGFKSLHKNSRPANIDTCIEKTLANLPKQVQFTLRRSRNKSPD